MQQIVGGWGLRGLSSSYVGPLINVCQGLSVIRCEDIGQIHNQLDVATASAYCPRPASQLHRLAYNQAINPRYTYGNSHKGASCGIYWNAAAASLGIRPTLTIVLDRYHT